MYYIKKWFLRKLFKILRKNPAQMPMVQYWKRSVSEQAKVTLDENGVYVMKIAGEKEVYPGFPRSHTLFGTLSKLKHEVKNQIFNETWAEIEAGVEPRIIVDRVIQLLKEGVKVKDDTLVGDKKFEVGEDCLELCRYDMVPPQRMAIPVRELWRAFTVLEKKYPNVRWLKEVMTYVLQEDDGYRMRLQWIIQIFNPSAWWFKFLNPIKYFDLALQELENAEVVDDMKAKIRLLRKVLMTGLEDPRIKEPFLELCKEVNWNKLKLTKADRYHFRGKYFKVDFDKFSY